MGQSRRVAVAVAVLVLVAVGVVAAVALRPDAPAEPGGTASATASATASPTPTPTLTAAPTVAPVEPSAQPTAAPTVQPTEPPAPDPGLTPTEVVVTFYGWDPAAAAATVGAYVPLVESGARCTLTVRQGATVLSVEGPASPDAATTSCGALAVPGLASGPWDATVTYTSATATGTSSPVTIEVP
ncbi:hypothetical protein [Actinotalea solisilvae]|uniref:hypothetical protein n=1 Tax=Actinotalea solisilvae TaxID=2072922 RepID=UPI0018F19699|nr:hypothetical protein [Actinotalea solisilvae]